MSLILEASTEHALLADSEGNALHLPGGPSLSKCLGAEVQKFVSGRSFERVIIGAGPGSFTGIRVVAAMGQALAFGWGVPLLCASSLTAFAPQEDEFAVVFDARSGGLYLQIGFDAPQRLSLEEAALILEKMPLITSPHPNKILHRLPQLASCNWRETRPNPALLERHAIPASKPINLYYLSNNL